MYCSSPIARNISLTFIAVFADVSINSREFSSAYDCASYNSHTYIMYYTIALYIVLVCNSFLIYMYLGVLALAQ